MKLESKLTRRDLFKAGGGLLAATALSACAAPSQRKEELAFGPDSRVTQEQLRSVPENNLWARTHQYYNRQIPLTEANINNGLAAVDNTMEIMQQSQNKYFREAIALINLRIADKSVIKTWDQTLDRNGEGNTTAALAPGLNDGKLAYYLQFDIQDVLNNSNGFTIAMILTHEAQHIKDFDNALKQIPNSVSDQEKLNHITKYIDSNILQIEYNAYAIQTEAYLEALRLGVTQPSYSDFAEFASVYQRLGKNKDSEEWKNFIAEHLQITK